MVMGGAAGTLASSLCYPLDTIRRRMQMVGRVYDGQLDAFATIWREVRTLPVPLSPALTRTLNGADRDDIPRLSYAMSEPVHKSGCKSGCWTVIATIISQRHTAARKDLTCLCRVRAGGHSRVLQRLGRERLEGRAVQRHPLRRVRGLQDPLRRAEGDHRHVTRPTDFVTTAWRLYIVLCCTCAALLSELG